MDLNRIILGYKNLKIGDKVKVLINYNSHNYTIGSIYEISYIDTHHGFTLKDDSGFLGNWITEKEISKIKQEFNKEYLVNQLKVFLEFLEDYEGDVQSSDKFEKEFQVYKILKEIKGTKSDFEKIKIISELI
jgi:hypothetical protein